MAATHAGRFRRDPVYDVALPVALVGAALAFGYALVAVASLFGDLAPVLVVALPVLPVLALAVFADPRVGVLGIVALFPVGTTEVGAVPLQLVQFAVVGVAVIVGLRGLALGGMPFPFTPLMGMVAVFCLWLVVVLPSAPDQQMARREVVLYLIGLLTAAVVVAACRTVRDCVLVVGMFLGVVGLATAATPFQADAFQAAYGASVVEGRATGIFTQPNQLGTFAATGTLIAVGMLFAARTARGRLLAGGVAVSSLVSLLLSLSRGAWIGFSLGVVVLLFKLPGARRIVAAAAVPVLLLALALGSFAPSNPQVEIVGQRLKSITGEKNPYDDRPAIWAEAVREIKADPLSGQGPGNFPVASTRATSESRTTFADHAHNFFLTWAAEDGLPAALLAVGIGVALHVRLRRASRVLPQTQGLVAGVAAALAAMAGQGMVDYTLRNSVVLTTTFVVLGFAFALDRLASE